jgi:hypothetical protein
VSAGKDVDSHLITIERSQDGSLPITGWTVAFDGTVTTISALADAMRFAAELGAKSWARDRRAISIVVREGETVTEIGRFEPGTA